MEMDKSLVVMDADMENSSFEPFAYKQKLDNPSLSSNIFQLCRAVHEIISISLW